MPHQHPPEPSSVPTWTGSLLPLQFPTVLWGQELNPVLGTYPGLGTYLSALSSG